MSLNLRLLTNSLALTVFILVPGTTLAQDVSPGAACSTAGAFNRSGGPELSGAGHFMVCSGGTWSSIISYSSTGGVQLPNSAAFTNDISPAAIGANQNDYAPTGHATASVLRLTASAAYNITGLAGGADGRVVTLVNVGTSTITLKDQDAASTAANRFAFGGDIVLSADNAVGLLYDSTSQRWRAGGGLPFESGLPGPTGCATIGALCADGTVFAGWHPVFQEHLFIPTTDQGTTSAWNTAAGSDDIATDSTRDGQINTSQIANSVSFPAFKACKDLTSGGYTDWYLPSQVELYYLWSVRNEIESGGNVTNFQNSNYWSSSESSINNGWSQGFSGGTQNGLNKTNAYRVRCIRR